MEAVASLSREVLPQWSAELLTSTGIDNGWRECGGIYLVGATQPADDLLHQTCRRWALRGIESHELDEREVLALEPALARGTLVDSLAARAAVLIPREAQIRNPRHLRALAEACRGRGVTILEQHRAEDFETSANRIVAVRAGATRLVAGQFCLTAGCWTGPLAEQLQLTLPTRPMRGQMVLLRSPTGPPIKHHVHFGGRYVVPRDDGQVLVGSTVEDVGYSTDTTESAVGQLRDLAVRCGLGHLEFVRSWAGLRPGSADGLPYLGALPGWENGWIAAGHVRAGLQFAPGTAIALAALMQGKRPPLDVGALMPGRATTAGAIAPLGGR